MLYLKSLSNIQSYVKYTHVYLYLNYANSLINTSLYTKDNLSPYPNTGMHQDSRVSMYSYINLDHSWVIRLTWFFGLHWLELQLSIWPPSLLLLELCVLRHFVKSLGFGWIWILKKLNTEFDWNKKQISITLPNITNNNRSILLYKENS